MPPRKSNPVASASAAAGGDESMTSQNDASGTGTPVAGPVGEGKGHQARAKAEREKDREELAIEDLTMPRTMVMRLAKGVLPSNTQIQKDASTAMSKGATTFINYISHYAQTQTEKSSRKTMNPNDVLAGISLSEFEFMIPRLEQELERYNDIHTAKRSEYRKKVRDSGGGPRKFDGGGEEEGAGIADPSAQLNEGLKAAGESGDRAAKRAKGGAGEVVEIVDGDTTMEDLDAEEDEEQGEDEPDEEEDEDEEDEEGEDGADTEDDEGLEEYGARPGADVQDSEEDSD